MPGADQEALTLDDGRPLDAATRDELDQLRRGGGPLAEAAADLAVAMDEANAARLDVSEPRLASGTVGSSALDAADALSEAVDNLMVAVNDMIERVPDRHKPHTVVAATLQAQLRYERARRRS